MHAHAHWGLISPASTHSYEVVLSSELARSMNAPYLEPTAGGVQ
jgi:hypothetical protein